MYIRFTLMLLSAAVAAGREVAITIDDLPRGGDRQSTLADSRGMTEKLLRPFRAGRIPVTGFVNECKDNTRELLPLWIAAGAELGNHTCSHLNLNNVTAAEFQADIVRGEALTASLAGRKPRYFRHPFLHTGNEAEKRQAVNRFLAARDYRVAPVTLDNSDYMFAFVYGWALDHGDAALAKRVRDAYLLYMESIYEFFERRSAEVTGHEIRQVLLIHASQLNADAMPDLLAMMKRRGYQVVSLDRALEDPAYQLAEEYVGAGGFSWIHRWSKTKGMADKGEPDEPAWVAELWRKLDRN